MYEHCLFLVFALSIKSLFSANTISVDMDIIEKSKNCFVFYNKIKMLIRKFNHLI